MFGAYKYVEPFALTATLKFNDTIIDQATIMIPISTAPKNRVSAEAKDAIAN
ncbi:MAG: hypothetical protein GX799_03765 [Crenarchaeota archaeon]|jgi:hypothetical protein|nr:hypothetical protein [Thermoproteota archaeon]